MTASHMTLAPTAHLPRNDFGQVILQDQDTNEAWWSLRDDAEVAVLTPVRMGTLNWDATLLDLVLPEGIREPDLYFEERAAWLHPDGVVGIASGREGELATVLTSPRFLVKRPGSWVRIHPSHYGVEVDSYTDHSHDAQTAWRVLAEAVRA